MQLVGRKAIAALQCDYSARERERQTEPGEREEGEKAPHNLITHTKEGAGLGTRNQTDKLAIARRTL